MHASSLGAPCATGDAAVHSSQPGEAVSSHIEADRFRLHNAISRCYARKEAAKRRSDFHAEVGANEDLQRLLNQLARLPVITSTKRAEG